MSSELGRQLTEAEFKKLCEALWSWTLCAECSADRGCISEQCPSYRLQRLSHFLLYYTRQCRVYSDATERLQDRTVKKHEDLWWIVKHIRRNPTMTKAQLTHQVKRLGPACADTPTGPITDQGLAIDLATRICTMINCYSQPRGISILEQCLHQIPWQDDISFATYIDRLFPSAQDVPLKDASRDFSDEMRLKLTASRLKKDLALKFRPTDDLASHLKLDRQSNTLEVFQHTAVLKEHLRLTKDAAPNLSISDSLKLYVRLFY